MNQLELYRKRLDELELEGDMIDTVENELMIDKCREMAEQPQEYGIYNIFDAFLKGFSMGVDSGSHRVWESQEKIDALNKEFGINIPSYITYRLFAHDSQAPKIT